MKVLKHKIIVLLVLVVVTIWSAFQLPDIEFNPHIHAVIDHEEEGVQDLDSLNKEDSLQTKVIQLILPLPEEGITLKAFKGIQKTTDSLLSLSDVLEVFSIANLKNELRDSSVLFLRANSLKEDLNSFKRHEDMYPKFVGDSAKTTVLYIRIQSDVDKSILKGIAQNYKSGVLMGSGLIEADFEQELQKDVLVLFGISIVMIIVVFLIFYRSVWALISTLIIVVCTVVISLSVFPVFGFSLHPLTVMMPTITAVIALSDVIHLFTRYQSETGDQEERIVKAWLVIRKPIVLTSITTLIGFMSLLVADSGPLNELGLSVSISIVIAYTLSVYVLPVLMAIGPEIPHKVYQFSGRIQRSGLVVITSSLLLLGAGYFALQTNFNSFLFEDQMNNRKLSSGLKIIEEQYSGIRGVEFTVSTSGNYAKPKEIYALDQLLITGKELFDWGDEENLIVEFKREYKSYMNGAPEFYQLSKESIDYHEDQLEKLKQIKVRAKIKDLGSAQVRKKEAQLKALATSLGLTVKFEGWDHLMDKSDLKITRRLFQGLLIALLLVSLILGLVFRNFKLLWLTLLVNVFPLVLLLAFMKLLGIDLNLSTAAIFTIAFGIAVDDTIHFIAGYQQYKNVDITLRNTGRAILKTSIVLALGFGVLLFSEFASVQKVGLLLCTSLMLAVLSDLILLPAILNLMESKGGKK